MDKLLRLKVVSVAVVLLMSMLFVASSKVLVDKVVRQEAFLKKEPREALRKDCWTFISSSGSVFECLFVEETTGIQVKSPVTAFQYRLFEKDPSPKIEVAHLSRAMLGDSPPEGSDIGSIAAMIVIVALVLLATSVFIGYAFLSYRGLKYDKSN